jgi:hypothetical protein
VKQDLPALLAEIADVVAAALKDERAGLAAALALASVRGGQRVYIPARPGPEHWLVQSLGAEAASAIARHFAAGINPRGAEIELPVGPAGSYQAERRRRARLIGKAIAANLPANEIAAQAGITRRAVHYAKQRAGARAGGTQTSLFDDDDAA